MSSSPFPPSAEEAEMNRIHYDLEYTEGISQRMRIPETLTVGPDSQMGAALLQQTLLPQSTLMQVPERIVVAGDEKDTRFGLPRDLDLIQSVSAADLLSMKAPPRVLTLTEQPLDSLETEQTANSQRHPSQPVNLQARYRKERCAGDNASVSACSLTYRDDASLSSPPTTQPVRLCPPLCSPEDGNINLYTAAGFLSYVQNTTRRACQQILDMLDDSQRRSNQDLALDINPDETGAVDASSLRRQIVKLNRRLQLLEEENKERSKREMILYSATMAFWIFNTWVWLRR